MSDISWIGLDWGTSNLRAFAVSDSGIIIDEASSDKGMGKLKPDQFEPAMLELIETWLDKSSGDKISVYACGMVGAKQGWREAQYRTIPCAPVSADGLTFVPTQNKRINVYILPGLCQLQHPDVMRGEETQVAGLLQQNPDYKGAVCLPGTHSKWVLVANGQIEEFTTYMTGEMFDLLAKCSVLKHSVTSLGWDKKSFLAAVEEATNQPENVAQALFTIRAHSLLKGDAQDKYRARLSGLLIGQELGLSKRYWQQGTVSLIGSNATVPLYQDALKCLGIRAKIIDARTITIAGLSLAAATQNGDNKYA